MRKGLVGALSVVLQLLAFPLMARSQAEAAKPPPPTQRSLAELLANQGTFCWPDNEGGCLELFDGVPNMLVWFDRDLTRCVVVDYAGLANESLEAASNGEIDLGTTITGQITEEPLQDGRAAVTIKLQFQDTLVYSVPGCDTLNAPAEFGYTAPEVVAGAEPALGDGTLLIRYIDTAPGRPLPDLVELTQFTQFGQEILEIKFEAHAFGDLRAPFGVPEGTPGKARIEHSEQLAHGGTLTLKNLVVIQRR
jgi:hypothetical protein